MKLHIPVLLRKALLACFAVCSAYTMGLVASAADLTLGNEDSLTIDYADIASIPDLENGTLQLNGDTLLLLSNCGVGDGKTYTLLTGVSALLDAEGNAIVLDSSNNAISHYFDTTRPGVGFWADATLALTDDGTLQLVRHQETVKAAQTITTRQTQSLVYSYYAGISFEDINQSSSSSDYGGAIYGGDSGTIRLSSNGSVTFIGNTASASNYDYAYGGAIYGDGDITLSGNGSVTFRGNTARSGGGAIYGDYGSTIELSGNDSVTFSGNTARSDGGAIDGRTIALIGNGSVTFSGNTATSGGAIYGGENSTITLRGNGSVEFSENTASWYGGAIYGDDYSTIELSGNDSVTFSGNRADANGGAIYGDGDIITLSGNGSVTFSDNTASYGGAIHGDDGDDYSTIALSGNGSVTFSGNWATYNGGAIDGWYNSTIELSGNDSVTFSGNRASDDGGAIYGRTIELSGNGSVTFSGNRADDYGGAIYGDDYSTIELSRNGSVTFSGNTASRIGGGAIDGRTIELNGNGRVEFIGNTASNYGGAIYGDGDITLSGNGSVTFSENRASYDGGAIRGYGNLNIRNNDSVLFEKNAEVRNETYRLRSIYAGGSGDVISLSASADKSIEFRDSVYIASDNTVNLNADYTDANGVVHKQTGDIIFTGKYTEQHLNELLAADGLSRTATEAEILNSRTTEVYAMTNLYGGRLRVEDGAVYKGYGITAHEDSSATVLVKDATLNHAGDDLAFRSGTTLELAGNNFISGDVRMLGNSMLLLNVGESVGCTDIVGNLSLAGGLTLSNTGTQPIENGLLMYVAGTLNGWTENTWMGSSTNDRVTWLGNLLVLNYNESTFNRYFNGTANYSTAQNVNTSWHHYQTLTFEYCSAAASSGGAIYGASNSTITLRDSESVMFSDNTASYGGAICGNNGSTIELSGNGSVTFSGNTASSSGGAIYGRTIALRGNGSVTFSGNRADASGGAIYGNNGRTIELSGNGSVTFSGNTASYGGAIYGYHSTIALSGNGSVTFSDNTASSSGGAIYGYDYSTIELIGNGSVTFSDNTASSSGGAIYGRTIALSGNGSVTFSGNRASYEGGAISGYGNLNIRNNDSVLFEKNAEVQNETYCLLSIYAGGSGDVISLSASAGKSIEFRDSVYIASGSTVNLNADYTDANGVVHKQTGDIIFTGKYTELHLNELLAADGGERTATSKEILNSRTTEVYAMTNLYGGRLRVEDGAVYKGYGITAHEDSSATVLVKDATLNHAGYDLTFHVGTTLELAGNNSISGNVMMQENSTLLLNAAETFGVTDIVGNLNIAGGVTLALSDDAAWRCENGVLLYVYGDYSGWEDAALTVTGVGTYGQADVSWVDNLLVLNYNAETFNCYFNGSAKNKQNALGLYHHYNEISFENLSSSRGGAIYTVASSPILLFSNDSVTFSGNTASDDGGAIYGYDGSTIMLSGNGRVMFSGNSASASSSSDPAYAKGGAIYGGTIALSGNGSVTFSGNEVTSSTVNYADPYAYGGAIYGYDDSTIELSENGSVTFCENRASSTFSTSSNSYYLVYAHGGAIYGSTIAMADNESVLFCENTADAASVYFTYAYGGAIYGNTITLSGNGNVTFSRNVSKTSKGSSNRSSHAYGGAIYSSTITLDNNGSVEFRGNMVKGSSYSDAHGGAIYGTTIVLTDNDSVTFSGNTADDYGGAIYGGSNSTIELNGNGSVTFSGNTADYGGAIYGYDGSTIELSGNGSVTFSENRASYGGAIYGYSNSTITLADNESVTFSGNSASRDGGAIVGSTIRLSGNGSVTFSGSRATYNGGAIYGGTIELSGNDSVTFSGNSAFDDGGAIRGYGNLNIRNNDSVLFEKNAEESGSSYRLRSIYAGGSGDVISLSAAAGKSIEFRDSVYIASGSTVNLNADYTDANGVVHKQTGDIIFTGKYTEQHLNELLASDGLSRTATEAEILNSRTTVVNTMTNLYGGRLRVEDGAVYMGYGITAHEDSSAAVLVKDATLNHAGYDLVFNVGTTLELVGDNVISGNVRMHAGSTLTFDMTADPGYTTHSGGLSIDDDTSIRILLKPETWDEERGALKTIVLLESNDASLTGVTHANTIATVSGLWGYKNAEWSDGQLKVLYQHGAVNATWTNESGDGRWNHTSLNWVDDGFRFADVDGANIILGAEAAGNILLEEEIAIGNMMVRGNSSYALEYGAGTGLMMSGDLKLETGSSLSIGGSSAAESVLTHGELEVAGNLEVQQQVSGEGVLRVDASLSAAGLHLTDEQATHSIGGAVTIGGAVEIAGSLSAGGSLSGTAVTVGGALSAASLTADNLHAASLRLTDVGASNRVKEVVSVSGAVGVAGSLRAAGLHLTDEQATHSIGGAVTIDGAVAVAGSVSAGGALSGTAVTVGGALSAASLTADSLSTASLRLTDTGASNTVKEEVSVSGAVEIAGSLSAGGALSGTAVTVGGALSAASLTADSLSAASLELTAADAANSVSGDLTADAVSLASGASLEVGGTLTAAEVLIHGPAKVLQAGAFGAETMNFVLDRAALESLNLSGGDTGTIARANTAMGSGFTATLNGGMMPVQAAAYVYDISVNGGAVQLTADYVHDGMQVWSSGKWVGQSGWTDFYIAGYDAVNGVETVDLGGDTVQGDNLFIAYEDAVRSSVVKNGKLEFEYVDMGGGQFELGENATMTTVELYGKGETLVMHRKSVLNATKLTLGTLALEGGELTVKNATINAMSGTEGTLNIERNGQVTVKSDVTLTGLENLGNLNLGKNTLTVNALVDVGGDVTAGEVAVQSRGSFMAIFDKLVADKVTVVNNIPAGRYTDDLSVGDGSAIGELVAEKLEVREGVVTLGLTDAATEQVLKALDLQEDAALVLNQQTSLSVTDELSATEGAELRLKQQASVSYGDMSIRNGGAAAQVVVNAYDLANDSIQELSHAHVAVSGDEDRSIDYKLTDSSVENTGSGKLYLTHAENTFSSISAGTGDITVMNQALALNLDELVVGEGVIFSAYRGEVELPEQEAVVSVSQSVSFGAGAHINADLKLQSGVRVEMSGPVSMGSDLYLEHGMTLGGFMLESIQRAEQGQTVVLFSGIDTLYLSGEEQTDAIALSHGVSASEYFVNLISSQERSYYLVYDNELPGEGVLSIAVSGLAVPEPTSSMLGLMGLVAFTLRRRRK